MEKSTLLNGNDNFKNVYFKENEKVLVSLAENGQNPQALFIGCSDSRVIPNLITDTTAGDLFVIRNIGNFVAPHKPDELYHSTASAIEYAVNALNVPKIIICGHTGCGAIGALYQDLDKAKFAHTNKWLDLGKKAKDKAILTIDKKASGEELLRLTEKLSAVCQLENLLTYPYIKERVDNGTITLHAWIYDMATGDIEYYDEDSKSFISLNNKEK